jgi:hypothetical protein
LASANFGMLRRESRSILGTMCMSFAGWRTSCCSSSMSLASSTSLLGMRNALADCRPVATNAFLFLSLFVPTLDVAPLSAMAEGMVPSRTACSNSLMLLTCSTWSSSCLSTWQVGGAVLSNIKFSFSFRAIALLLAISRSSSSCPGPCQLVGAVLPA